LTRALQIIDEDIGELKVLDLGCGNGRSTRLYIDMGLRPEQICGLDLRVGTIELAKLLNPAVVWKVHDGTDLPTGFNWISSTTVFSSVTGRESRLEIVERIHSALPVGGYAFYYDGLKANDFAGGDLIDPPSLFSGFEIAWSLRLGRFSAFPIFERLKGLLATRLSGDVRSASLREIAGDMLAPSQEAFLFRKT
jgi:SAM-dependent methyltransferase